MQAIHLVFGIRISRTHYGGHTHNLSGNNGLEGQKKIVSIGGGRASISRARYSSRTRDPTFERAERRGLRALPYHAPPLERSGEISAQSSGSCFAYALGLRLLWLDSKCVRRRFTTWSSCPSSISFCTSSNAKCTTS